MPNTTDQHSWYYPADGERDYEDTFETFFEQLDNDVEIRDTDANKSNYDPKAGAKYVATDTQKVYLGDGSSWNHLVTTGKNPTFDSADVGEIDIGKLIATLDANGYDITNNGTTVYDASTDTVGDGTTNANHQSVSTGELEATNESLVKATMSADQSGSSGSGSTKIVNFDTESKDERGEFDTATGLFTPDKDGWYFVVAKGRMNVTDGDTVVFALNDETNSDRLARDRKDSGGGQVGVIIAGAFELTAGVDYSITVGDFDSSWTLKSADAETYLSIRRAFR